MIKLRLGVILPDVHVPVWVARMLEQVKNSAYAEIISMAYADDSSGEPDSLYENYFQLDRRIFRPSPSPWELTDVRKILQNTQLIGETLQERIARFKSMRLDVVLNLSLHELPKSVLDVARFGVWSLRCNDGRITTGTDTGWLELLKDGPLIDCVVETQRGDSLQAIARSVMASHPYSFTHNQKSFLWRASALVPRALRDLHAKGEAEFFSKADALKPAKKISKPTDAQAMAWRRAIKTLENKTWRRWFPDRWALMAGVRAEGEKTGWNGLNLKVPPRGAYWADPFLIGRQGRLYVFFEEYIYKDQRGRISFAEIQPDGGIGEPAVALERPYHLSYPFIFEHRGEFYMIPETAQNNAVEVYRCARFPDQWKFHKTLMQDVHAVDATLTEHSGVWWMFVNIAAEGGSTWDELHLFHSDDPLSDQWTPHPMNPVVSDVRSARPAGRLFRRDGLLLRPSQDSSLRYGYALNINRITKLTKYEFEEEPLERLEPPKDGDFIAVHTFNFWNDLTVIDVMMKK
jgi:hypothetical protein